MKKGLKGFVGLLLLLVIGGGFAFWRFSSTVEKESGVSDATQGFLSEDVLIYTEESEWEILEVSEETILVSEGEHFQVGSILSSGVTDQTPDGLLRKVEAIEEVSEGYQLTTRPAALTEAIEYCDIYLEATLTEDGTYQITKFEEEGERKDPEALAVLNNLAETQETVESSEGMIQGEFGVAAIDASMTMTLHMVIKDGEIVFSFELAPKIHTALSKEGLSVEDYQQTIQWLKEEQTQTIPIYGLFPLVLRHNIIGSIEEDVAVSTVDQPIDLSTFDMQLGFDYSSKEGLRPIQEDHSQSLEINHQIEAFNGTIYPSLSYEMLLFGTVGSNFQAGIKTEGKIKNVEPVPADTEPVFSFAGTDLIGEQLQSTGTIDLNGSFVFQLPQAFNIFDASDHELSQPLFDEESLTLWEIDETYEAPAAISLNDFEGLWKYPDTNEWAIRITKFEDRLNAESVSIPTGESSSGYVFAMPYGLNFQNLEEVPISISGYEMIAGQGHNISPPLRIVMSEDKQRLSVYHYGSNKNLNDLVISDRDGFFSEDNLDLVEEFVRMSEDQIGTAVDTSNDQSQQATAWTAEEAFQLVKNNLPNFFSNGQEWAREQANEDDVFQFAAVINGEVNLRMYIRPLNENDVSVDFYTRVSSPQGARKEEYIFSRNG